LLASSHPSESSLSSRSPMPVSIPASPTGNEGRRLPVWCAPWPSWLCLAGCCRLNFAAHCSLTRAACRYHTQARQNHKQ
jgi:hypothetical protein